MIFFPRLLEPPMTRHLSISHPQALPRSSHEQFWLAPHIDNRLCSLTRIRALDKAETRPRTSFRVLCAIQSNRGKKASIIVDWGLGSPMSGVRWGKAEVWHQVVGRTRIRFLVALSNGDVGGGKRDVTGGKWTISVPSVCVRARPSLTSVPLSKSESFQQYIQRPSRNGPAQTMLRSWRRRRRREARRSDGVRALGKLW